MLQRKGFGGVAEADLEGGLGAGFEAGEAAHEGVAGVEAVGGDAIAGDDDVALLEAGFFGGGVGGDLEDEGPGGDFFSVVIEEPAEDEAEDALAFGDDVGAVEGLEDVAGAGADFGVVVGAEDGEELVDEVAVVPGCEVEDVLNGGVAIGGGAISEPGDELVEVLILRGKESGQNQSKAEKPAQHDGTV